jgi:hypothetical protein
MDLEQLLRQAARSDGDAFAGLTRRFPHFAFGSALALVRRSSSPRTWRRRRLLLHGRHCRASLIRRRFQAGCARHRAPSNHSL